MTLKTYFSNSNVSVNVTISNELSALVTFAPQIEGGSMFYTTDTSLQSGLESHSKFGKLFVLKESETVSSEVTYPKVQYYGKESEGGTFSQVNSDWNADSGVAKILNKPNLSDYATTSYVNGLIGDINSILDNINGEVI